MTQENGPEMFLSPASQAEGTTESYAEEAEFNQTIDTRCLVAGSMIVMLERELEVGTMVERGRTLMERDEEDGRQDDRVGSLGDGEERVPGGQTTLTPSVEETANYATDKPINYLTTNLVTVADQVPEGPPVSPAAEASTRESPPPTGG